MVSRIANKWTAAWSLILTSCLLLPLVVTSADDSDRCRTPRVSRAVNGFGLDLFSLLKGNGVEGNIVFSPIGISTAASFLSLFANGDTKTEVDIAFRFVQETIPLGLIQKLDIRNTNETNILAIANGLFFQDGFSVESSIVWDASVRTVDFANPEEARTGINQWVDKATGGQIPEMFSRNTLKPQTKLVIANAVYFQGLWKDAFKKDATQAALFVGASGEEEGMFMNHFNKQFMWKNDSGLDSQILELPYEGDRFSMYIVLPNFSSEVDLIELVQRFAARDAAALFADDMENVTFSSVSIPKFEIETVLKLHETLPGLGVNLLFDPLKADLSAISEEQLYVDTALHNAKIVVDETGTEAAAATAITVLPLAAPFEPERIFVANRPFLYFVVDKLDCVVLFMGSVETLQ